MVLPCRHHAVIGLLLLNKALQEIVTHWPHSSHSWLQAPMLRYSGFNFMHGIYNHNFHNEFMIMRNISFATKIFVAHAYLSCVTMYDKLRLTNYRKGLMNIYECETYFKRLDLYIYIQCYKNTGSETSSEKYQPINAQCDISDIMVNIGSGNGLSPGSAKPLPEAMPIRCQ